MQPAPETAFVDQFQELKLGSPVASTTCTPFFIRLIHPVLFDQAAVERLSQCAAQSETCAWEIIPKIENGPSFLGTIALGEADGHCPWLSKVLYTPSQFGLTGGEKFLLFRLKDQIRQTFKQLYFSPCQEEIALNLDALEFIPFQMGVGFLSVSFSIPPMASPVPLRVAVDVNYYLPFVQHSLVPLVRKKLDKQKEVQTQQLYVPSLFQRAWESLQSAGEDSGHLGKVWGEAVRFEAAGNLDRFFLMAYAILAVDDTSWGTETVSEAREFYHQITRWSRDSYRHAVQPLSRWKSPETTRQGIATRSYSLLPYGLSCIGLGANEFERNNYLPIFRESNFFALLLAWQFEAGLKRMEDPSLSQGWLEAFRSFTPTGLFGKPPRQQFFEACLEGKGLNNFPTPELQERIKAAMSARNQASEDTLAIADYVFRQEGDYWTVKYQSEPLRLKNSKGLRYISYLLHNPNKYVKILDLYNCVEKNVETRLISEEQKEKARKAVTASISRVLERLRQKHEQLWLHLYKSLKTGRKCIYISDPSVVWRS